MAPVSRSPNTSHPAKRCPRKLTSRRQMMVLGFMDEFRANPQQYSRYGTDEWMSSLVEYMCESPRYGLTTEDIKNWLNTKRFFSQVNAEYGYRSRKTRGKNARRLTGGLVPALEEQPNRVDSEDDTTPLGHTVEMEVDHGLPDFSDEVALDLRIKTKVDEDALDLCTNTTDDEDTLDLLIKTEDDEEALDLRINAEVDQDALEERRPSIGPALNDASFIAVAAAGFQPICEEAAEYPGLVEAVQGAMVQYSQDILGCYPAVLPSQTSVSSLPEGIRQLQDYAAKMNDVVVDLGYDESTIINVGGWYRANNLLRELLSDVENHYVDPSVTVES